MTDIKLADVMAWIEEASKTDLEEIADEMIDRDLACSLDDLADLERELERSEENEFDGGGLLEDAAARLRRHEYREALHVLSNALGRDFDALNDLPLVQA